MTIYGIFFISSLFFCGQSQWTWLAAKGSYLNQDGVTANRQQLSIDFYDIGQDEFNQGLQGAQCPIIRRECSSCDSSHNRLYYRRLTDQATFEPWSYFLDNWSSHRNLINNQFELYENWFDAMYRNEKTKWTFCDYDDRGIGFPRNCGSSGDVGDQWNTFYSGNFGGGQPDVRYALYTGPCDNRWTVLAAKGSFFTSRYNVQNNVFTYNVDFYSLDETAFNNAVEATPTKTACDWIIIRYECLNCGYDHKDIYYKRLINYDFNYHQNLLTDWESTDNTRNLHFNLFSSFEDALNDNNPWSWCNFDDQQGTVGFPRDCGPTGQVNDNWVSYYSNRGGQSDSAFTLYTGGCYGV